MSFPYTSTTPAANEAPSGSQPLMQQNFNSISNLIAIDHETFGNATGGQHKQVTFVTTVSPAAPTGVSSVEYTAAGVANTGVPQIYWKNVDATFPLSAIKAFGVFTGVGSSTVPSITVLNGYNILSVSAALSIYTVTLNAGVTTGNNVIPFILPEPTSWSFAAGVLTFRVSTLSNISVLILQI